MTAARPKGGGSVGLAGDRVGDVEHHGGTEQAVYAYAREDYRHFEALLGHGLRAGVFGENLTVEGHDLSEARIGERWRGADGLALEVTCPRIPCGAFRGWMGVRGWLKTFTREARPGAHLKVVEPGAVERGGELEVVERPGHEATIAMFFKAATGERELIPRVLEAASPAPAKAAALRSRYGEGR